MRVVLISKAFVVGAYQKKCEELAALPGIELTVIVPQHWHEPRVGEQHLERRFTNGYRLEALPLGLNGRHHLHFYWGLGRLLRSIRPEVLHIDEESFNLATYQAMRLGVAVGARCCFYNYANIDRFYPPPFGWFEQYSFRHAVHAMAANQEASTIIRRHGYQGPITIIPQVGVDPDLFVPPTQPRSTNAVTIGYVGRLVPEKGLLDLLDAMALLPESVQLRVIGDGSQREALQARASELGLTPRIEWRAWVSDVPAELRDLDILVLPSRTTRTWKEQFGRILVEAMACGVAVVGSASGEIPHVIADAGLTFPEGDALALARRLRLLADQPALRAEYARRGRARVLANYTQAALAKRYADIYRNMAG